MLGYPLAPHMDARRKPTGLLVGGIRQAVPSTRLNHAGCVGHSTQGCVLLTETLPQLQFSSDVLTLRYAVKQHKTRGQCLCCRIHPRANARGFLLALPSLPVVLFDSLKLCRDDPFVSHAVPPRRSDRWLPAADAEWPLPVLPTPFRYWPLRPPPPVDRHRGAVR